MNKKQKVVAKKHRRNKERLKALKQASIAVGTKKADKAAPKSGAKVAPQKAAAKKTATKKPAAKKATAAKKKPAAKKTTKKATGKKADA